MIAAALTALSAGLSFKAFLLAFKKTCRRMVVPLLAITPMLGLAYTTRYSASMRCWVWLSQIRTDFLPFFAPFLGWLGVALTGSDTSSNALFGVLQKNHGGTVEAGSGTDRLRELCRRHHGKNGGRAEHRRCSDSNKSGGHRRTDLPVCDVAQHCAGDDRGHHRDAVRARLPGVRAARRQILRVSVVGDRAANSPCRE